MKLPDQLAPYASLLKWALIAAICLLLLGGGFKAGCSHQAGKDRAAIAKKDKALAAAATSLRASAVALRAVNAEAERRIAQAELDQKAATAAGAVAEKARQAAEARNKKFDKAIQNARRDVTCAMLLDTDVRKVCRL